MRTKQYQPAGMKHLIYSLVVLAASLTTAFAEDIDYPYVELPKKHLSVLNKYCFECHDSLMEEGDVDLEKLSLNINKDMKTAETWQKVLNAINSGEMPPEDEKQIPAKEKTAFLDDLFNQLVTARKILSDTGGEITMRRLNHREYENTIKYLLGVNVDTQSLPADGGGGTLDTIGSSQYISSDQIEQYLELGRSAIDESFQRRIRSKIKPAIVRIEPEKTIRPGIEKRAKEIEAAQKRFSQWKVEVDKAVAKPANQKRLPELVKQNKQMGHRIHFYKFVELLDGVPPAKKYGFKDAFEATLQHPGWDRSNLAIRKHYMTLPHRDKGTYLKLAHGFGRLDISPKKFVPGTYRLRVRLGAVKAAPASRRFIEVGHPYSKSIDPARMALEGAPISQHHVTGTITKPQTIETTFELKANSPKTISVRERQPLDAKALWDAHNRLKQKNGYGHPPAIWIDWVELEGPLQPAAGKSNTMDWWVAEKDIKDETDRARKILEQFSLEAMRGSPPSKDFIDQLIAIFKPQRKAGEKFDIAIRTPLSIILASPSFLYLNEPKGEKEQRKLTDRELAVRLSYFLWSAPPDETLLGLAERKELSKPNILRQQVDRMIADPRSDEFISGFVHQWLDMERLDFFQFDPNRHREFDESMRASSRQELYQSFAHLFRGEERGRIGYLLKSHYVIVNSLLATYYGIEGVTGDEFRKVILPKGSVRGGLLGMAAIHAMGSDGIESSPVERGAWVLRHLLHNPPPPAPPNVPQLSRLADKPLNARQKLTAHMEEPQCASCHRKIDPIGFGMENFNAAGEWRTIERRVPKDKKAKKALKGKKTMWKIDPSGKFYKGPEFGNFLEMRDLISKQEDKFARGFTEHLIEYALGRPFGFTDEDLAVEILSSAKEKNYTISEFFQALVSTKEFQSK